MVSETTTTTTTTTAASAVGSSPTSTSRSSGCGDGGCCSMFGTTNRSEKNSLVAPPSSVVDDALLAKEMNELSVEERNKVFDDIHGVSDALKETPEIVETALKEFDAALAKLPSRKRQTLDRAIFLKPSIETDTKFKLMFLRGAEYDAPQAVRRMAKYFEDKVAIFGEDKIVQEITMEDLTKEDIELLNKGPFLYLPQKDTAGRTIFVNNVTKWDFTHEGSMLRVAWYTSMVQLQEEASQLNGFCHLVYSPSGTKFNIPMHQVISIMLKAGEVLSNMPARMTCGHFCYDSANMEFILGGFRRAFGRGHRLRLRAHYGSPMEIQYKLMSYGVKSPISFAEISAQDGGEILRNWKQARLETETAIQQTLDKVYQETVHTYDDKAAIAQMPTIPYPKPKDILVGRGAPYQTYSGNIMLSDLIEKNFLDRYSQATDNFEKTCLHLDVIKKIQEVDGGRFIERTSEGWKVVEDKAARKKVNSSFRSKMAKYPTSSNDKNEQEAPTITLQSSSSGSKKKKQKKTKQPISSTVVPTTTTMTDSYTQHASHPPPQNDYMMYNHNNHAQINNNNNTMNFFQMAWGGFGGNAKRARYNNPGAVY